jgi:hypothetical protein
MQEYSKNKKTIDFKYQDVYKDGNGNPPEEQSESSTGMNNTELDKMLLNNETGFGESPGIR